MSGQHFEMRMVPPPSAAPISAAAESLGLLPALRVNRTCDQYRCSCCHKLQPPDAWEVWLPDYIKQGDSPDAVTEACRRFAFNGHFSAWCLSCGLKLSGRGGPVAEPSRREVPPAVVKRRSFWRRVLDVFWPEDQSQKDPQ